jgi:hypothetical protein
VPIAPVASVVQRRLTPEALDVVSVVLGMSEAAVCEAWVTTDILGCPSSGAFWNIHVRADRAFLALPKYVGFRGVSEV